VTAATPQTLAPTEKHGHDAVILALVCVAQFMVVLDVSIVNVALPSIGRDLHYSATGLQWVVNAYVLTFAGFLLLGGRAADLYGRRRVFIAGLAVFSLASLLGGFAQNSGELTAARALQGVGGAILSPATLTIIMTTFREGAARNRALGLWSATAGAGGAFGAVLGGVLTNYLTWRWVLFVNVPIGALAVAGALAALSEGRRPAADRSLDIAGSLTATAGLGVLVYGIVGTDRHPWGSGRTITLLAIGVALLAAFIVIEARFARAPLMPLSLFRSRSVTGANVVMALTGVAFFSMWYFLSLYLQDVHRYGPLKAGLLFLPMSAAIITGTQISSRSITRFGARPILFVGLVVAAAGFLWLGQLDATSSYVSGVLGGSMLTTFGIGLAFTPLAAAATTGVPWHQAGLASGVLNTARQVGGSIGLAALATLATDRTHQLVAAARGARSAVPGALTSGFDRAFTAGAIIVAIAAVVALTLLPAIKRREPQGAAPRDVAPAGAVPD
jgi:EmrB/QacA subfamily drug resistance transporter